jgi:hypothetical protein
MLSRLARFCYVALTLATVLCVFVPSSLPADEMSDGRDQKIAIWQSGDRTYLCVPSGIDFRRVEAIANALEQFGHGSIELCVDSLPSLPPKPSEGNPERLGDCLLIRTNGTQAYVCPGFDMPTLRRLVEALHSTGIDKTSLIALTEIVDPLTNEWRFTQNQNTTSQVLHGSSGGRLTLHNESTP